jgi:hypothetical protein
MYQGLTLQAQDPYHGGTLLLEAPQQTHVHNRQEREGHGFSRAK